MALRLLDFKDYKEAVDRGRGELPGLSLPILRGPLPSTKSFYNDALERKPTLSGLSLPVPKQVTLPQPSLKSIQESTAALMAPKKKEQKDDSTTALKKNAHVWPLSMPERSGGGTSRPELRDPDWLNNEANKIEEENSQRLWQIGQLSPMADYSNAFSTDEARIRLSQLQAEYDAAKVTAEDLRKRAAEAEAAKIQSDVQNSWGRWVELAGLDRTLTGEEKAEARTAVEMLDKELRRISRLGPDGIQENRGLYYDYTAIKSALENKTNVIGAGFAGAISSIPFAERAVGGVTNMADKAISPMRSEDVNEAIAGKNPLTEAANASPVAGMIGNVAGNIGLMLGAGSLVKGATAGWDALANAPKWIQAAVQSGLTFGSVGTLQAADRATAEHGLTLQAAADTLKGGAASFAGGAAGGALSYGTGFFGGAALQKLGLYGNKLAEAAVSGLSGTAFAAGRTSISELARALEYPDGYEPDMEQIGKDMIVAFAFATLSSLASKEPSGAVREGAGWANNGKASVAGAASRIAKIEENVKKYYSGVDNLDELDRVYKAYLTTYHPDLHVNSPLQAEYARMASDFAEAYLYLKETLAFQSIDIAAEAYRTATTGTGVPAQRATEIFNREAAALIEAVNSGMIAGSEAAEAAQILNQVMASGALSEALRPMQGVPASTQPQGLSLPSLEPAGASPIGGDARYSINVSTNEAQLSGLIPYTSREAENLHSGKNYVAWVDMHPEDFVNRTLEGKGVQGEQLYLGRLSQDVAESVSNIIGEDIQNYGVILSDNAVKHIINEHGNAITESNRGQIAVEPSHIAMVGNIVGSPNAIFPAGQTEQGKQLIRFEKQINGWAVAVEVISDKKKGFLTKTLYIIDKSNKDRSIAPRQDAQINEPRGFTPKTVGVTASVNNIPQNMADVNQNIGRLGLPDPGALLFMPYPPSTRCPAPPALD